mgnify:FL=1
MTTDTDLLNTAIDCAKNFEKFEDVLLAVSLHAEWLTLIPSNRQWAILHQIIFSGNVNHLDQLLALQKSNKDFRLCTNTRLNETVLDIAKKRSDVPAMIQHIQRLIQLDDMLTLAKACEWDRCFQIVQANPNLINEKPPYRRYYLIHHMAFSNAIEQYKRFKQITNCVWNPTLQADRKKIHVLAHECGHIEFAKLIEKDYPSLLDENDCLLDEIRQPTQQAIQQTKNITLMIQSNVVKNLDDNLIADRFVQKSRHEVVRQLSTDHSRGTRHPTTNVDDEKQKALVLDNLTCPLTMNIFIDPGLSTSKH